MIITRTPSVQDIDNLDIPNAVTNVKRSVVIDFSHLWGNDRFMRTFETGIEWSHLERLDLICRILVAVMYNHRQSGHPGGSMSMMPHFLTAILNTMNIDFSNPRRQDADVISLAAGHKAIGLYAALAVLFECLKLHKPGMLPENEEMMRMEDLLGFRLSGSHGTPLMNEFGSACLEGHPTPATPFIRLATGASGIGDPASFGISLSAFDTYGENCPWVHVFEGEGGITPGRVFEGMEIVSSHDLCRVVLHIDWNQSTIDSDYAFRMDGIPGQYSQLDLQRDLSVFDWNVIYVPDGTDLVQIALAQSLAVNMDNHRPTVIVYKTVKGKGYIEGRKSHGAGHKYNSPEFYTYLSDFETLFGFSFARNDTDRSDEVVVEKRYWNDLLIIRNVLNHSDVSLAAANLLEASQIRLDSSKRNRRDDAPDLRQLYIPGAVNPSQPPDQFVLETGTEVTFRGLHGDILGYLNDLTHGAFFVGSADLLDSTNIRKAAGSYPNTIFNTISSSLSRVLYMGIREDGGSAFMSGVSSAFGPEGDQYLGHIGVISSYSAFIVDMSGVAARLYTIGQGVTGNEFKTLIILCGHASLVTGPDGDTHAESQFLQKIQECFPRGYSFVLTPGLPDEIWPLYIKSLLHRPALLFPAVIRSSVPVLDRNNLGLNSADNVIDGVYVLADADMGASNYGGTIVLQGAGVLNTFLTYVWPELRTSRLEYRLIYVGCAELFDLASQSVRQRIFPPEVAAHCMMITDFTPMTTYRWVISPFGRRMTMHPFQYRNGYIRASDEPDNVYTEVGLDGPSMLLRVNDYGNFVNYVVNSGWDMMKFFN